VHAVPLDLAATLYLCNAGQGTRLQYVAVVRTMPMTNHLCCCDTMLCATLYHGSRLRMRSQLYTERPVIGTVPVACMRGVH
jgi:hypothetical protein